MNSFNKKLIIFFIVASFIILFAGVLIYYFQKREEKQVNVGDGGKNIVVASKPYFPKLVGAEYKPLTKDDCEQDKDKLRCYDALKSDEAFIKNDFNLCGEVIDQEIRNDCYRKLAVYLEDVESCNKIDKEKSRDMCRQWMAVLENDSNMCNLEGESYERGECHDRFNAYRLSSQNDVEGCKKLKTLEYPNLCFKKIMINYGMDCSKFAREDDQKKCVSMGALDMAIEFENWELCRDIPLDNYRRVCYNLEKGVVDEDGDGLTDMDELFFNTNPFKNDTDGDGLSDNEEINVYHTNPVASDTDNDGIADSEDVKD